MKILKQGRLILSLILFCLFIVQGTLAQTNEKTGRDKMRWLNENEAGFYNVTTFSVDFFKAPVINGMQTVCGYRLNPYIAIGGGIGLERYVSMDMYDTLTANLSLMPVFGEIRYTIVDKKVSPVIALQGGYKFMLNRSSSDVTSWRVDIYPPYAWTDYDEYDYYHEGGFFFNVEAGVRWKVYKRLAAFLSGNFSVWSVSGDHYIWTYQYLSAPDGQPKVTTSSEILPTTAYNQVFLLRFGFAF